MKGRGCYWPLAVIIIRTGLWSAPERKAAVQLVSNVHSVGNLILFVQSFASNLSAADNPVFTALAGVDSNSAIPGFDPGISSAELYGVNDVMDDIVDNNGWLGFTPEMSDGGSGGGVSFLTMKR